jgi:hypothetical protein
MLELDDDSDSATRKKERKKEERSKTSKFSFCHSRLGSFILRNLLYLVELGWGIGISPVV